MHDLLVLLRVTGYVSLGYLVIGLIIVQVVAQADNENYHHFFSGNKLPTKSDIGQGCYFTFCWASVLYRMYVDETLPRPHARPRLKAVK